MDADMVAYLGLFFAAFVAATLLPTQSELVLAGLVVADIQPVWALVAVATVGNSLGSSMNWLFGRFFSHYRGRRWFPVNESAMERAVAWYRKYGRWSLICSWMPIIGDPLTFGAGVLREPFSSFFAIVVPAKMVRYTVVAGLVQQLNGGWTA